MPSPSPLHPEPSAVGTHMNRQSFITTTQVESPSRIPLDMRSLEYTTPIDENLTCPICRIAFINPITTSCDHVFCSDCFNQSYGISPTCPVDRCSLSIPGDIGPTPRIILNQLDGLQVKCPNTTAGCEWVLARSMVQNHVDRYCDYTLVSCTSKTCKGKVTRKDIQRGCLHYDAVCPDCEESLEKAEMERHRERDCEERRTRCEKCGVEVLRCRTEVHEIECTECIAPCKWAIFGCSYRSKRKDLVGHASLCDFKIMGPLIESLKEEITSLRTELHYLNERDKAKDRRIKFLESEKSIASSALVSPVRDILALPDVSSPSIEYAPFDSRDKYLLFLLESQETKVDHISTAMTELEAKQTMMLFNETIPIKEQLAELRSAQGVLGMHVRWLMNFRLQERRPAPRNEPKSEAESVVPELRTLRRSSDTTREHITKL